MASYAGGPDIGFLTNASRSRVKFDFWLVIAAGLLITVGLYCLYSEGIHNKDGGSFFRKQMLFLGMGVAPFAAFAFMSPRIWMRAWPALYLVNIAGLVAVLVHGSAKNGAARWIELGPIQFQPSEMAKILTVITLASFYVGRREAMEKLSTFVLGLAHIALPMLLIFLQPHTGAAMVIAVIWLAVSVVARVPFKFLGPFVAAVGLFVGIVATHPKAFPLLVHNYQLARMGAGVEKQKSKAGIPAKKNDYQTHQAEVAFGSGGVIGEGFLKGERMKTIPEVENDFVFTIAGEELGLVGCTLILAAFGFLFYRIWLVMLHATEPYYRMLAAGVLGILVFHTLINLLMITGIIPVIGLWLPFMSYGGTALWLCMSCIGLVISVRRHERPILF
jgi:rod shape determining protein RodA